jgi:hypothetical protein
MLLEYHVESQEARIEMLLLNQKTRKQKNEFQIVSVWQIAYGTWKPTCESDRNRMSGKRLY